MPLLFLCYVLNCMDRMNIGLAQLQMKPSLGFSDAVYGLAAGIFFVGYFLFEVPSNLLLRRIGARKTMTRVMVLWGLASTLTLFVSTPAEFYVLRFLLGVFEAGFFPGIVLYLTFWFPREYRARVVAWFMVASVVAGAITGPVSGWILKNMHNVHGWEGWQWMFLLEGIPSVLMGLVVFAVLPEGPSCARWLTEKEKALLQQAAAESSSDDASPADAGHGPLRAALGNATVWKLAVMFFCILCCTYALAFWLPTMIKRSGVADVQAIGMYTAIPNLLGAIFMIWFAQRSDARRERRGHYVFALCMAMSGLGGAVAFGDSLGGMLVAISVVACGAVGAMPIFWAIATSYLSKEAAPAGIALINSVASLAGMVSPAVLGAIQSGTGKLDAGMYLGILLLFTSIVLLTSIPVSAYQGSRKPS